MKKSELSDEEIIELSRQGDKTHLEEIYDRYKNMVRIKVSEMFVLGGEVQDLNQEGMIGLFKATRDYNPDKDAKFSTFAEICVSRQLYNAIKKSKRFKNAPLNEYVSLSAEKIFVEGDSQGIRMDDLEGNPQLEPERHVIRQENVERIHRIIDTILTATERDVFYLHVTGIPTSKIGAILNVSAKSADNALQRAKGKLRKALAEE